jgi:hypothetical protein
MLYVLARREAGTLSAADAARGPSRAREATTLPHRVRNKRPCDAIPSESETLHAREASASSDVTSGEIGSVSLRLTNASDPLRPGSPIREPQQGYPRRGSRELGYREIYPPGIRTRLNSCDNGLCRIGWADAPRRLRGNSLTASTVGQRAETRVVRARASQFWSRAGPVHASPKKRACRSGDRAAT